MSVESISGSPAYEDKRLSPQAKLHLDRLHNASHKLQTIERILAQTGGEAREFTYVTKEEIDGEQVRHEIEIDITPELHRGIARVVMDEREALIKEGYPHLAQALAPQSAEPPPPAKDFLKETA